MDKVNLGKLGGQLGVLLCLVGFVVMFLGWNGASSYPNVAQQFPYLISGGVIGLAIVVVGAALLIVQNHRVDRARLEAAIDRLAAAVDRQGGALPDAGVGGYVVAGQSSYHRVDCTLAEARDDAELVGINDAIDRGLSPCRVCTPPRVAHAAVR